MNPSIRLSKPSSANHLHARLGLGALILAACTTVACSSPYTQAGEPGPGGHPTPEDDASFASDDAGQDGTVTDAVTSDALPAHDGVALDAGRSDANERDAAADAGAADDAAGSSDAEPPHDAETGDATADGAAATDAAPEIGASEPPDANKPCAPGFADCDGNATNGCETDVAHDPRHCGVCTHDCTSLPHVSGGATCTAGACEVPAASCQSGFGHCSSTPDDGCETDLSGTSHCGSCTNMCGAALPVCGPSGSNGYACNSGCTAQAPDRCGSSCVDTTTDVNACGQCNNACASPSHATATCAASACGFACNGGYHLCGGTTCDDDKSIASCGASCTPCAAPANAMATCDGTTCGFSCDGGFHVCSDNLCHDSKSTASCGASCTACPAPPSSLPTCDGTSCGFTCFAGYHTCGGACDDNHSVTSCGSSCSPCAAPPTNGHEHATCDGSTCGLACDAGYVDCDGNPANGCEANLSTDLANCGACGHDCVVGSCAAGSCQAGALAMFPGDRTYDLVVDAQNVYFTTTISVRAVAKAARAPLHVLGRGVTGGTMQGLAQDASYVYWADGGTNIGKTSKTDFTSQSTFATTSATTGATYFGLAVGGSTLYYTTDGNQVGAVSTSGGGATVVRDPLLIDGRDWNASMRIAADASGAFFTTDTYGGRTFIGLDGGAVLAIQPGASNATPVYASGVRGSTVTNWGIALDANNVYFGRSSGELFQIPRAGGTAISLSQPVANATIRSIAVDSKYVYWVYASVGGASTSVMREPIGGGAAESICDTAYDSWGIAVDDKGVYWTTSTQATGLVMMLAK